MKIAHHAEQHSGVLTRCPLTAVSEWATDGCGAMRCDAMRCDAVRCGCAAIRHLPDVEVLACAARSLDDAKAFAKLFKSEHTGPGWRKQPQESKRSAKTKQCDTHGCLCLSAAFVCCSLMSAYVVCSIPRSYGSYAEIAADPDIEVMYVGTLHPQHAAPAMLCLNAGKHVLVEKPFAVTAADGAEVIALAQRKGLFLMEAMWTRFIPSICKVRELIAEGVIGTPKMVHASFGFLMQGPEVVPRLWQNQHAGGCTLDLAVYPIALASMIFGEGGKNAPSKIMATGDLSEGEKVDTQIGVTLQSVGRRNSARLPARLSPRSRGCLVASHPLVVVSCVSVSLLC